MTPFFKIFIQNEDGKQIEEVDSFLFEDCIEEDSYLNISLGLPKDMPLTETPYFKNGVFLYFYFGYLNGLNSKMHKVRIVDVDWDYLEQIKLTLKCLDLGSVMKKTSNQKIWKKKTTLEIATEILEGYGLAFEYDEYKEGNKVWDSIPQGNKSDFDFIRYLVSREVTGNYTFYIRGETAYIVQRPDTANSRRTFIYGDGSGTVVKFKPSFKESTQKGAGDSSRMVNTDSNGNTIKEEDKNDDKKGNGRLYDANSVDVTNQAYLSKAKTDTINYLKNVGSKEQRENTQNLIGLTNNPAVADSNEAKNLAKSKRISQDAKVLVATLTIEGDPTLQANEVINMKGVAKPHQGAWVIVKATHEIKNGGYLTMLELSKGYKSNKSQGKKQDNTDTTEVTKSSTKYRGFTENADEVKVDSEKFNRKRIGKGGGSSW